MSEKKAVSKDEALKALQSERVNRELKCRDEIKIIMETYQCAFDPVVILKNGQNPIAHVNIVAI